MFIHVVLFALKPKEVVKYRKDSLMWASCAKQSRGFVSYQTMKRYAFSNQYASVYQWGKKRDHDRFMREYHDLLVKQSAAKVRVLGYYNLKGIDKLE
jgi:hypothetical protein